MTTTHLDRFCSHWVPWPFLWARGFKRRPDISDHVRRRNKEIMSLWNVWNVLRIRSLLTLRTKSFVIALDISDLKLSFFNQSISWSYLQSIHLRPKETTRTPPQQKLSSWPPYYPAKTRPFR